MIQRRLHMCIPFVQTPFITSTTSRATTAMSLSSWMMIGTIGVSNGGGGGGGRRRSNTVHHQCRSLHHHITHPIIQRNSGRSYRYSSTLSSSSSMMMMMMIPITHANNEPSDSRRQRRIWMKYQYHYSKGNRIVRSFSSWWRGGGGSSNSSTSDDSNDSSTTSSTTTTKTSPIRRLKGIKLTSTNMDVSKKRQGVPSYPKYLLRKYNEYPVSTCSIQGYRHQMEDEYMVHTATTTTNPVPDTDSNSAYSTIHRSVRNVDVFTSSNQIRHEEYGIVGCFDGHGGSAVAGYLRQNLFKNIQAALHMIQTTKPEQPPPSGEPQEQQVDEELPFEDVTTNDDYTSHPDETIEAKLQAQQHDNDETKQNSHYHPICHEDEHVKYEQFFTKFLPNSIIESMTTPDATTGTSTPTTICSTVEDYISALEVALDKINREVLKVKHWSKQGSTAIVCWIHTEPIQDYEMKKQDYTDQRSNKSKRKELNHQKRQPPPLHRTIITANIGDCRAILCRNGTAIVLSRDHKPNDPIERERIEQLGGTVAWDGVVDWMKEPIPGMGVYRLNDMLSISRAIGDRMARPMITSDPDITVISILPEFDEFIVVATDGLWDVMSTNDTIAFIRALLHNTMDDGDTIDRDTIATYLVEEALRRGSFDNITVIIVWLQ
jgi:serine/threonine protein phosphatase PrpC